MINMANEINLSRTLNLLGLRVWLGIQFAANLSNQTRNRWAKVQQWSSQEAEVTRAWIRGTVQPKPPETSETLKCWAGRTYHKHSQTIHAVCKTWEFAVLQRCALQKASGRLSFRLLSNRLDAHSGTSTAMPSSIPLRRSWDGAYLLRRQATSSNWGCAVCSSVPSPFLIFQNVYIPLLLRLSYTAIVGHQELQFLHLNVLATSARDTLLSQFWGTNLWWSKHHSKILQANWLHIATRHWNIWLHFCFIIPIWYPFIDPTLLMCQ